MRNYILLASSATLAMSLSACGGAGTSGPAPIPAPPSTPAPTPTPTPNPDPDPGTQNPKPAPEPHTEEYRRSAPVFYSKAQYAYDKGYTGEGVTIAIIDTGIDIDNPEFAGRISDKSKSFESSYVTCTYCPINSITYPLDDVQGHGTWVASVAAGAKNDGASHGVAYGADILALKIVAPNLIDENQTNFDQEGGVNGSKIPDAIKYAMEMNAFVSNISLNNVGKTQGAFRTQFREAMDIVRQKNGLIVQSVSNQSGDSFDDTYSEHMVGSDLTNKDWFLFGIRLDNGLNPIEGNGTPGLLADRTLAVPANSVLVTNIDGEDIYVGGNSFAAPAIAGAAALLKQYWPQLGGQEISQILLSTATDLGEPGPDQLYGAGLLNIEAAFKAEAPTIGNGSAEMSSIRDTALIVSPAFGGTAGSAVFSALAGQAVVLDAYGRDYKMNVSNLVGAMRSGGISLASLAINSTANIPHAGNDNLNYSSYSMDGRTHKIPSAKFGFRISPTTAISGSFNSSIDSSDMITGSLLSQSGIATTGATFNLHKNGKKISFGAASSSSAQTSSSTQKIAVELANGLMFSIAGNRERGSALGMRGAGAFQIDGAKSTFATIGWGGTFAGLKLSGEALAGRTKVQTQNSMIDFDSAVLSSGFRFKAEKSMLGGYTLLGFTSPLKVERAHLRYTGPVGYDLTSKSLVNKTTMIDLSPAAREYNLELGWARQIGAARQSYISLNSAYGMNSGNVAGQTSAAAWLRYGTSF